jgi:hypothetical protein
VWVFGPEFDHVTVQSLAWDIGVDAIYCDIPDEAMEALEGRKGREKGDKEEKGEEGRVKKKGNKDKEKEKGEERGGT